jgi:hypothetical protein
MVYVDEKTGEIVMKGMREEKWGGECCGGGCGCAH